MNMGEVCRFGNNNFESKESKIILEEKPSFVNTLCIFVSLISILADLTTDTVLFVEYCKRNDFYWALGSIMLFVIPSISMHIFSMRWFLIDMKTDIKFWCTHLVLIGVFYRYITFIRKALKYTLSKDTTLMKTLSVQRNDLILLHFLYVSIGTVPQIILQSYSIIVLSGNYHTRVISLTASIASVLWAFMMYIMSEDNRQNFRWVSFSLKIFWHFGMLTARIAGVLIFTVIFGIWTLLPMGIHWAAMTFWIITQKTTFCPNKLEETFYNVIMGFIYCFCYINICEGHTRYRLMVFYTLMVTQNFASLFLFILISDLKEQKKLWSIVATVSIVAGTVIGIFSMLLYYRWFHAKGPITWKNDMELNNKVYVQKNELKNVTVNLQHARSFKSLQKSETIKDDRNDFKESEIVSKCKVENADKKFLLDHWIARSGTPTFVSAPIGNNSMEVSSIEFHTVENTPQTVNFTEFDDSNMNSQTKGKPINKHKKLTICPPTELNIKLSALQNLESSIDELTSKNLILQKRRGICSSDVLRDAFESDVNNEDFNKISKNFHGSEISHDTDGSNKKTSSDSIDMDLDLSFSDINSSDINTFNENIVQKLCLSALKNIKVGNQDADIENIQRIALDILKEMYVKKGKNKKTDTDILTTAKRELDTPTEMLSVHDYENICAVNIAREAWGLRSWNGYCDIENWRHDGSVVRDPRCDTFTSGSSEISSCTSQEIKNCILSGLQHPLKKIPYYSNVFVKHDESNQQSDYVNTVEQSQTRLNGENSDTIKIFQIESESVFPVSYVTDNANAHLEPIIEELDDLGDMDLHSKTRLNSESSLVATIDEIRKATVTNSPKCVYHRREHLWDSPQLDTTCKLESNLKHALWKEPSKFDSSNIMKSLPEKENVLNEIQRTKFDEIKKEINIPITSANPLLIRTKDPCVRNKNVQQVEKSNVLKNTVKKLNNENENDVKVLSNKKAHVCELVSENSVSHRSIEDLCTNQMTSSLQSLISKDDTPTSLMNVTAVAKNISNYKRAGKNKPRRKFSLLREKFEPKTNRSDEEALYQHSLENLKAGQKSQHLKIGKSPTKLKSESDTNNENFPVNFSLKQLDTSESETNINLKTTNPPESTTNIKEKQSPVMKQVLNPQKCNTKLKY